MLLLAVLFVIMLIKQFWHKLNFFLCAVLSFVLLFGALSFCDIDAQIAKYNVDKYLSGELGTLDVGMIESELSASALPALLTHMSACRKISKSNYCHAVKQSQTFLRGRQL
jgi:hypothetical protein